MVLLVADTHVFDIFSSVVSCTRVSSWSSGRPRQARPALVEAVAPSLYDMAYPLAPGALALIIDAVPSDTAIAVDEVVHIEYFLDESPGSGFPDAAVVFYGCQYCAHIKLVNMPRHPCRILLMALPAWS